MRRKFDNLILDYRKLGLDNENLLKRKENNNWKRTWSKWFIKENNGR